jgi:hypothetical protein
MKVGTKVSYKENNYTIVYDYGNGQVEMKKDNERNTIELVNKSELKKV